MVACTTQTNSQMTGRKPWELQISHQNRIVLLPVCTVSTSGVCKQPSLFWSVTQSHLGAHQITISHVKEDSNTFHMTSNTLMFINEILIFWHHSYLKQSRPRSVTLTLKYSTPPTEPSFLPRASSRTTPAHSPGANLVSPRKAIRPHFVPPTQT